MARSFNGSSDKIVVPSTGNPTIGVARMAASLWIYPVALPASYAGILSQGIGLSYRLYLKSTGKLALYCQSGSYDGTGAITLATGYWYHIAMNIGGPSNGVWVNNSLDATAAFVGWNGAANDLWMGNDQADQTRWFQGSMADFAVWNNISLSQGDIAALSSGVRAYNIRRENLTAYYPLSGFLSPEPELILHRDGPLTGTAFVADPPKLQPLRFGSDILYLGSEGELPMLYLGPATAPLSQTHFRFRTDTDAVDATPTWGDAEDAA